MREDDGGGKPLEKCSGATMKRKHIYLEDYRPKKPKSLSQTQTLNAKSVPQLQLPVSNQFEAFRSSSSSSRRHNWSKNIKNQNAIESPRNWVFSSHDCSNYKEKVIVVSYNILGVENAANHRDLYLNVPPKFLQWPWRKSLIRKEISRYNAGILCLQEVDRFSDLDKLLQEDGFKGVYKARTGESCDGCALFWKDELFTLLHEENIEFRSFGLRDNVAQLCVLKMNQNEMQSKPTKASTTEQTQSRSLVVGNIHVLYNPKRGDIKLGQVRRFIEKAHELSQAWGGIPVVLAGDYNSLPQSAMYQFVESSGLNIPLHDRRTISGQLEHRPRGKGFRFQNKNLARCSTSANISRTVQNEWSEEELMLATGSEKATQLQHKLKLYSAYLGVPGSRETRDSYGEPLATSYHSKFMGTVDYLWHTNELVPVRVLDTLPVKTLRNTYGLPSKIWGSDHLALVCELAFADEET